MDGKKKNRIGIALLCVLVCLLVGMIVSTALLSRSEKTDWEYVEQQDAIDYYASEGDDANFQVVSDFRNALVTYFNSLINDKITKILDVESYMESYFGVFADKMVDAMSRARISGAKLRRLTTCLKENSLETVFSRIPQFFKELKSVEELEDSLQAYLSSHAPLNALGGFLSSLMRETGLTENEIAKVLYCYLEANAPDSYAVSLRLMGETYFTEVVSDTVYAISTFGNVDKSHYQTVATAYSIQSVLYQLGSLYVTLSSIGGGVQTVERVFMWTWEYDESHDNAQTLNELSQKVRGKIGKLLVFAGYFMKTLSVEDIEEYLLYSAAEDEEKADRKITSAIGFSKAFRRSFTTAQQTALFSEESDFAALMREYSTVSDDLRALSEAVLRYEEEEDGEIGEEFVGVDYFVDLADGVASLSERDVSVEDVVRMRGTDAYAELATAAEKVHGVNGGISAIINNVVMIWIGNAMMKAE